jgi:hypothetical protein
MRVFLAIAAFLAVVFLTTWFTTGSTRAYYSIQERRLPCGKLLRREVVEENDAWRKTVTLLDSSGRVLEVKTRTIEPEQCNRIRAGQFIPGLWRDCSIPF